jgi:hypothetical protein
MTPPNEQASADLSVPPVQHCAGITPEFLSRNEVHQVTAVQANKLCGIAEAGLIFPYLTLNNGCLVPLRDPGEQQFHRLRKDVVKAGGKYHQRAGTAIHAYLPVNILEKGSPEEIVLTEGEKKALSLCDPHHRFTLSAVGLTGFYGFQLGRKGDEELRLVPELEAVLSQLRPKRIQFIGDNDTVFNYQFFQAVVRLRLLLPDAVLILPRIPLDQPKGVDDCHEKHGTKFEKLYEGWVEQAEEVHSDDTPEGLALRIALPQLDFVAKMDSEDRSKVNRRLIRFAAAMPDTARAEFLQAAKKPSGLGLTDLKNWWRRRLGRTRTSRMPMPKPASVRSLSATMPVRAEVTFARREMIIGRFLVVKTRCSVFRSKPVWMVWHLGPAPRPSWPST